MGEEAWIQSHNTKLRRDSIHGQETATQDHHSPDVALSLFSRVIIDSVAEVRNARESQLI
jgi:hypothetical protein